jgi:hypothetical protein
MTRSNVHVNTYIHTYIHIFCIFIYIWESERSDPRKITQAQRSILPDEAVWTHSLRHKDPATGKSVANLCEILKWDLQLHIFFVNFQKHCANLTELRTPEDFLF